MKRPIKYLAVRESPNLPDPGQGRLPNILERMAMSAASELGGRLGQNIQAGQIISSPVQFADFQNKQGLICQGRLKNMNCGLLFAIQPELCALLADLGMGGLGDAEPYPFGPAGKAIALELGKWIAEAFGSAWRNYSAGEFFEIENIFIQPEGQLPFESREHMLQCSFELHSGNDGIEAGSIIVLFPWRELAGHARMLSGPPMPPISFGQCKKPQTMGKSKKSLLAWLFPRVRFADLLQLPDLAIANILGSENPQLQAAILTFLPKARANAILNRLKQPEAIRERCRQIGLINDVLLKAAEDALAKRAAMLDFANTPINPFD